MSNVLLVEGVNDYHVVGALCRAHGLPNGLFETKDCKGDDGALRTLNASIIASEIERPDIIGLMLDADRPDVAGRWQSIRHKLQDYPYLLPERPVSTGTIVSPTEQGFPKLGFWLMPNNQDIGMLEDFLKEMMPFNCLLVVEQCLIQAQASGCTTYKPAHQSKAIVHTYLAWQDEPGRPLGQAITARALTPGTNTAMEFTAWLGKLFN